MTEVMISSSVLILILCLFRYAFKGRVSSKVLYAMWGLAALRLLLPFSILGIVFAPDGASSGSGALLPASPYSVLSLAAGVKEQAIDGTVLQPLAENVTKGYVYTAPETDSLLVKLTSVDWEPVILVIAVPAIPLSPFKKLRMSSRYFPFHSAHRLQDGNPPTW